MVRQYATNKTKTKEQKTNKNKQNDYKTQTWHLKKACEWNQRSRHIVYSMWGESECVQTQKHHWSSFQTAVTRTNTQNDHHHYQHHRYYVVHITTVTSWLPSVWEWSVWPINTHRASARPFVHRLLDAVKTWQWPDNQQQRRKKTWTQKHKMIRKKSWMWTTVRFPLGSETRLRRVRTRNKWVDEKDSGLLQ